MERIISLWEDFGSSHVALGLVLVCVTMLVFDNRRLGVVSLLLQYAMLGLVINTLVFEPITWVRVGLGFSICVVLYLTASRVQRRIARERAQENAFASAERPGNALTAIRSSSMGLTFRVMVLALGGLVGYGLWRTWPITFMSGAISLAVYWLIVGGLLMTMISSDPMRLGFGVLTFCNGVESIYLHLEQSLIVIGFLGIVDALVALAIVVCVENWLASFDEEEAA